MGPRPSPPFPRLALLLLLLPLSLPPSSHSHPLLQPRTSLKLQLHLHLSHQHTSYVSPPSSSSLYDGPRSATSRDSPLLSPPSSLAWTWASSHAAEEGYRDRARRVRAGVEGEGGVDELARARVGVGSERGIRSSAAVWAQGRAARDTEMKEQNELARTLQTLTLLLLLVVDVADLHHASHRHQVRGRVPERRASPLLSHSSCLQELNPVRRPLADQGVGHLGRRVCRSVGRVVVRPARSFRSHGPSS